MRLATFELEGQKRVGIVKDEGLIDLARHRPDLPETVLDLIAAWSAWVSDLTAIARDVGPDLDLKTVRLHAPIPRPGKILALGLNYRDHILETGLATPDHQTWFCKQTTSVTGPFDPIERPSVSEQLDHEAELVFVIGRGGRHISKDRALEHVFGYCVGNDVSVRDWQMQSSQWMLGKSFDTHAPFGPWLTTADEVADPHALDIRCVVNGEVRQASNTREQVFPIADQIAHLSAAMTLEPGDVIFTGTPSGVGLAHRRWLAAGDRVAVEIEGLGRIENLVRDARALTEGDVRC